MDDTKKTVIVTVSWESGNEQADVVCAGVDVTRGEERRKKGTDQLTEPLVKNDSGVKGLWFLFVQSVNRSVFPSHRSLDVFTVFGRRPCIGSRVLVSVVVPCVSRFAM